MLAQYCWERNPKATPPISEKIKKLRSLVRLLDSEIKHHSEEKNRLHSSCDEIVSEFIKKSLLSIEEQIKLIEKEIMDVINSDEKLNFNYKLLLTVPCIGQKMAWIILSEYCLSDINEIYPKGCIAHAGLSPRAFTSGSSVKGRPHISKIGGKRIRSNLYMPSLTCIYRENYFGEFYKRLVEKGKAKKVAIIAVSRKILLTAMGVLKNQQPFDLNWAEKTREKYMENFKIA